MKSPRARGFFHRVVAKRCAAQTVGATLSVGRVPPPPREKVVFDRNRRGCQSLGPGNMQRAVASRHTYTRAIFRTHSHLADEAAGILVAGGAIGCAVAGMKLPRAREGKTVALEADFDRISPPQLPRASL